MTPVLLDANALIALTVAEHEHHDAVAAWSSTVEQFALCPIVEGALVRFMSRLGESPRTSQALLARLHATGRFEFWPDDLSFADIDLEHVRGHRQVTDTYLAALASSRGTSLATLDVALSRQHPEVAFLIPR